MAGRITHVFSRKLLPLRIRYHKPTINNRVVQSISICTRNRHIQIQMIPIPCSIKQINRCSTCKKARNPFFLQYRRDRLNFLIQLPPPFRRNTNIKSIANIPFQHCPRFFVHCLRQGQNNVIKRFLHRYCNFIMLHAQRRTSVRSSARVSDIVRKSHCI